MKIDSLKTLIVAFLIATFAMPVSAVTEKEMEQAKAITAQAYLRYANDGSDYLDKFTASSMSELEGKLKAKEKENIKAFKQVKVPSDYASWDKEKLVEFWSATFFASPALSDKGKIAKARVRKRIQAMKVSAPVKEEKAEDKKNDAKSSEKEKQENAAMQVTLSDKPVAEGSETPQTPTAEDAMQAQESIFADQQDIASAMESELEDENAPRQKENTWIYLLVLAILVIVVVALVVFATKTMKKNSENASVGKDSVKPRIPASNVISSSPLRRDNREQTSGNEESSSRQQELNSGKDAEIANGKREIERLRGENAELATRVENLTVQKDQLIAQLQQAHTQIIEVRKELELAKAAGVKESEEAASTAKPKVAPKTSAMPSVIYLGRVNPRGIFIRADRRLSIGNTVYRLDTADGVVGTFRIAKNEAVDEMIIMDPEKMLASGCVIVNPEDIATATEVETETAGTAVFEDGYWKVLRKAKVLFR